MNVVALIPARGGSKRVPGKNIRLLGGKPLIQWTIEAALQSGVFADVCVVTDDDEIALAAGGDVRVMRRSAFTATDDAPDILWVREFFNHHHGGDAFAILRPTSPFRTAETIRRAFALFETSSYDSIRAVEPVTQHPGKMWFLDTSVYGGRLEPITADLLNGIPWHSCPTQSLPMFYRQNASLEMARVRCVLAMGSIAGNKIGPFFTEGYEGFDINTEDDWTEAERIMAERQVTA